MTKGIRVRVAGLLFHGDDVLIVEHQIGSESWNCFPGGALEFGETLEDCLRRELQEELALSCEIVSLAAVGEFADRDTHSIEFFFGCRVARAPLETRCSTVKSARFVDRRRLVAERVFPLELSAFLQSCTEADLLITRYYGRFA